MINAVSKMGAEFQKSQPTLMALATAWLGPLAMIGGVVIDSVTGQWDKILPDLDNMSKQIGNSWDILALKVAKSFQDMGISARKFFGMDTAEMETGSKKLEELIQNKIGL